MKRPSRVGRRPTTSLRPADETNTLAPATGRAAWIDDPAGDGRRGVGRADSQDQEERESEEQRGTGEADDIATPSRRVSRRWERDGPASRYPGLRIVAPIPAFPSAFAQLSRRCVRRDSGGRRSRPGGWRLPAYSGGTAWDSHPLRLAAGRQSCSGSSIPRTAAMACGCSRSRCGPNASPVESALRCRPEPLAATIDESMTKSSSRDRPRDARAGRVRVGGRWSSTPSRCSSRPTERIELVDLTDRVMALVRQSRRARRHGQPVVDAHHLRASSSTSRRRRCTPTSSGSSRRWSRATPTGCTTIPEHSDCDRMNADSHLRAMLLGHSLTLQISGGELVLGQWQRVLVGELDGPRARTHRASRSMGSARDRAITVRDQCVRAARASRTSPTKLDAGERLSFEDGVRLFECPDLLRARLARQPRARAAARRAHVLQLQHPARGDQRLRRELPVLLVRAAAARRSRVVHDVARAGSGTSCAQRADQPLTEVHVVNGLHPGPAVRLLHGHAARLQARSGPTST